MSDIDQLSRKVPVLCKVAPAKSDVHMEDVHRAGGIMSILGQLDRAGLLDTSVPTVHAETMAHALDQSASNCSSASATSTPRSAAAAAPRHAAAVQIL